MFIVRRFLTLLLFISFELTAYYDPPPCYEQLPSVFFNPIYVSQALSLHNVWQSEWTPIIQLLREEAAGIPKILRERADRMRPSPLDHPFDPVKAYKLMNEALFAVYERVLMEYRNYRFNPNDIIETFIYIREQQYPLLEGCFGKKAMDEIEKSTVNGLAK
jgi:hypothetical protein